MTRTQMSTRLDRVLIERRFRPVFQPVIDLEAERTVGFEALTRLDDGQPILDCLRDAEEIGIRPDVELVFLEAALDHTPNFGDAEWISVNISPSVLVQHCDTVGSLIDRSHASVVLELTENEPIHDYAGIRRALSCLAPTTRLCLDDLGAGYAYIHHVVRMQADYVKLDREWTARLPADPTARLVVTALVEICQQFGITFIAEGIEDSHHLSAARALGVTHGQGYLFGYPGPLPAEAGPVVIHPQEPRTPTYRRTKRSR